MNCDRSTLLASQISETSVIRVAHLLGSNASGSAVTSRVITNRTVPDASAYCVASWLVGNFDGVGLCPSAFRNVAPSRIAGFGKTLKPAETGNPRENGVLQVSSVAS